MWKHMVEPGRPQMIIWCMHITCWISKATNVHSEYVIYIYIYIYILLFCCNDGCPIASQCYIIRTLPVLSSLFSWYIDDIVDSLLFYSLCSTSIPLLSLLTLFLIRFVYFFSHFIFPPALNLPIGSFSVILYYNPYIQLRLTISVKYTSMK